jgi:hypothetical protein
MAASPIRLCCPPSRAGISSCHAGIIDWAVIVTLFVLVSLPSLCWHCCPCCAGVVALVVLVLPLSAMWSTTSSAA